MKRRAALLTIMAGVLLGGATILRAGVWAPQEMEIQPPPGAIEYVTHSASSTPARLAIPSIGVDASVVDVGIGRTGNMAVPLSYSEAGWYRYGPVPGEKGSAVLDGHVDNGFGLSAVFKRLGELKAGDDLYVYTKGGALLHFMVSRVESYLLADVPARDIFTRADGAYLNLITCAGAWDGKRLSYDRRIVVYAVYVGQPAS